MGMFSDPQERLCYVTVDHDNFQSAIGWVSPDRWVNAYARLYDASGKVVAEERLVNCLP